MLLREMAATLEIFVDTKHQEVAKLESVGCLGPVLYSLIASFCREYLGQSLKKWSPRFLGMARSMLRLFLAKRRSEFWVLLKDDIGVVHKGGQKQVVRRADVQVVNVGGGQPQQETPPGKPHPRILQIVDQEGTTGLPGLLYSAARRGIQGLWRSAARL